MITCESNEIFIGELIRKYLNRAFSGLLLSLFAPAVDATIGLWMKSLGLQSETSAWKKFLLNLQTPDLVFLYLKDLLEYKNKESCSEENKSVVRLNLRLWYVSTEFFNSVWINPTSEPRQFSDDFRNFALSTRRSVLNP